ncbi:unnamed protein product [Ectocarpus sp. 13 AM-2016]
MLLEFNHWWNLRMMVENRGLPAAPGGRCNKYLGRLIQRDTADRESSCPVPQEEHRLSKCTRARGVGSPGRSSWGEEARGAWSFYDDDALCVRVDESSGVSGRPPLSHLAVSPSDSRQG